MNVNEQSAHIAWAHNLLDALPESHCIFIIP